MNMWQTTEPPRDGTTIIAVGRVIATDEFSTAVEPFVSEVVWIKDVDGSGYEGWHYAKDRMSIAMTLDDEVKIDWWALPPAQKPKTKFCLSCGATHKKEICPECDSDAQDDL